MDLVATPGSADANSYVDLAYAQSYFETRLGSDDWLDEDDDLKITALIQSTRILDSVYDWNGWQATDTQSLRWPRDGATNYDQAFGPSSMYDYSDALTAYYPNDTIPRPLKDGVCEMAMFVLQGEGYSASIQGLKLVKVGPIRVDFDDKAASYSVPNAVIEMLRNMGSFSGSKGGNSIGVARLVRT